MKKITIALLLFISPLSASQPTIEEVRVKLFQLNDILDNADLYALHPDFMIWLDGYCYGLKYAIDGDFILK
jgi:hypothetical protein